MPLHPFQSRKKRLDNGLTAFALGIVFAAMFVFMSYDGERFRWEGLLTHAVLILFGLIGLVVYVRGGAKR